ncbi:MAG: hypothetical protein M1825_005618 [Sarcosagium campestre]|nr:MAG: hypothetical protein M1825_005618 [Sarcosagium campestre]
MGPKKIEQWEVERYWEIFSIRSEGSKYLTGAQAAGLLKNSQLRDDQLERVWDLADVDNDGNLDFEEFCVAMRLIFDLVNGEYPDVPSTLPDWLVPESKAHLVQATRALSGGQARFERPESDDDDDDDTPGLRNGFDWYMSPTDKAKYEEIYSANKDTRGEISFDALTPLYSSLASVPDTDIHTAWSLINPSSSPTISHAACLAFLHILSGRHSGFRVPRTVPPSLRASFERNQTPTRLDGMSYRAPSSSQHDDSTSTGRKAKFGDAYLSRIGRGGYRPSGTDVSSTSGGSEKATRTTDDWEEVRLKRQLADLEAKMAKVEESRRNGRGGSAGAARSERSRPALVKRELEQLLDYKRRELRELESAGENGKSGSSGGGGGGLRAVEEEVGAVREQVEGLEAHLRKRLNVLEDLRREVEDERRTR